MRALGGVVFTVGMLFFLYNVLKTIEKGRALEASGPEPKPLAAQA